MSAEGKALEEADPDDVSFRDVGLVHIERMDTGHVWMAVYHRDGSRWVSNFITPRNGRLLWSVEEDGKVPALSTPDLTAAMERVCEAAKGLNDCPPSPHNGWWKELSAALAAYDAARGGGGGSDEVS